MNGPQQGRRDGARQLIAFAAKKPTMVKAADADADEGRSAFVPENARSTPHAVVLQY